MAGYKRKSMYRRKPVYRKKPRTVKAIAKAVVKRAFRRNLELRSNDQTNTNVTLNDTAGAYAAMTIYPYTSPATGTLIDERQGFSIEAKGFVMKAHFRCVSSLVYRVCMLHLICMTNSFPTGASSQPNWTGTAGPALFITDVTTSNPANNAQAMEAMVDTKNYKVIADKVFTLGELLDLSPTNNKTITYSYRKSEKVTYSTSAATQASNKHNHVIMWFILNETNVPASGGPSVQMTTMTRAYYTDA